MAPPPSLEDGPRPHLSGQFWPVPVLEPHCDYGNGVPMVDCGNAEGAETPRQQGRPPGADAAAGRETAVGASGRPRSGGQAQKRTWAAARSAEETLQQELDDKAESVPESSMDDQTALAWKADANGGDSIRQGSQGGAGADEQGGQRSHRGGKGGETGRNGGAGADEKGGSAVSGCDRLRGSVAESCSVSATVPRVMAAAMLMEQKLEYGKLMLPNSRPTSAMSWMCEHGWKTCLHCHPQPTHGSWIRRDDVWGIFIEILCGQGYLLEAARISWASAGSG